MGLKKKLEPQKEIFGVGPLKYKIYPTAAGTWYAYIRWAGKSWGTNRVTKEKAIAAIRDHADTINNGVREKIITESEAIHLSEAKRLLEPYGITISDAARFYVQQHQGLLSRVTVESAVQEIQRQKHASNRSKNYLDHLKVYLNVFAKKFGSRPLIEIHTSELNNWIMSLNITGRSRNNYRSALIMFFRWAKRQGYLPHALPVAAENTERATQGSEPVTVISPETLAQLLTSTTVPDALTYFMFGSQAGIRTAELERLDWASVNLESGHIEIGANIAKTASRRLIPISASLKAWLNERKEESGPIITTPRIDKIINAIAAKVFKTPDSDKDNGKWPKNCLRHSYISYRLAELNDVAKVALEAGNSPAKIFSNYRSIKLPDGRLITADLAKLWFETITSSAQHKSA